jgi:High potential iron-sulfur protein
MNSSISRRRFIAIQAATVAVGSSLLCASTARAQSGGAHLDEASEQATALGYHHDSSKVDGKKYPKHNASQHCKGCSFWQGKPEDPWAGCAMFGRKQIANAGWCQVWAKVPG